MVEAFLNVYFLIAFLTFHNVSWVNMSEVLHLTMPLVTKARQLIFLHVSEYLQGSALLSLTGLDTIGCSCMVVTYSNNTHGSMMRMQMVVALNLFITLARLLKYRLWIA